MELKDIVKPAGLLAGLAAVAAGTLAVGYLVTRDRETLRRVVRVAAGTVERVSAALAETREELIDLWAEARDDARQAMDDEAFAATNVAESAADVAPAQDVAEGATPPPSRER